MTISGKIGPGDRGRPLRTEAPGKGSSVVGTGSRVDDVQVAPAEVAGKQNQASDRSGSFDQAEDVRLQPTATFLVDLEAQIPPSVRAAPLEAQDVAALVAILQSPVGTQNASFAPAADILRKLKRLMDVVDARRVGSVRGATSRKVEAIDERRQPRPTPRQMQQQKTKI